MFSSVLALGNVVLLILQVSFSIDVVVWLAKQSCVLVKVTCFRGCGLRVNERWIRFGGFRIPGDTLFFCICSMVWELLLEEVG